MTLLTALFSREKTKRSAVSHTIRTVGKASARSKKKSYAMWNKWNKK